MHTIFKACQATVVSIKLFHNLLILQICQTIGVTRRRVMISLFTMLFGNPGKILDLWIFCLGSCWVTTAATCEKGSLALDKWASPHKSITTFCKGNCCFFEPGKVQDKELEPARFNSKLNALGNLLNSNSTSNNSSDRCFAHNIFTKRICTWQYIWSCCLGYNSLTKRTRRKNFSSI